MYFVNYASTQLVQTNAKTLSGAKRAARNNCIFQGQTIRIFMGSSAETAVEIARRYADPIDMNLAGEWEEL